MRACSGATSTAHVSQNPGPCSGAAAWGFALRLTPGIPASHPPMGCALCACVNGRGRPMLARMHAPSWCAHDDGLVLGGSMRHHAMPCHATHERSATCAASRLPTHALRCRYMVCRAAVGAGRLPRMPRWWWGKGACRHPHPHVSPPVQQLLPHWPLAWGHMHRRATPRGTQGRGRAPGRVTPPLCRVDDSIVAGQPAAGCQAQPPPPALHYDGGPCELLFALANNQ